MRWTKRLAFTLVTLPLFYLFGLPWLIGKVEAKAQAESYRNCKTYLEQHNMANVPTAIMTSAQAEEYCHCVSDPIRFTRQDMFDLAQKKQPIGLKTRMDPVLDACNRTLQDHIDNAVRTAPKPRSTIDTHGTETIYFN